MSKFCTSLAVIAALSTAPFMGPSFAKAMTFDGGVPRCESTTAAQAKAQLATELHLSEKLNATIDAWNGCLKVCYSGDNGHTVTAFYDPDTLMAK